MATWIARNTGLTGAGLLVKWIVQNPATKHLNSSSHELWIATDGGGIYHSINGGESWNKITLPNPSQAEFMEPVVDVDDLEFIWVGYDPLDDQTLYALGAEILLERLWMYKTTDNGLTWISRGIQTP